MDQFIITVAPCPPNAFVHSFPDLPHTPEQIADEVVRAWQAGAAITHLHVIDEKGQPTQNVTAFKRTVALIRERCDIIIEGSSGGAVPMNAAERSVALQCDIDMASLNPGSVNFEKVAYVNTPQDIEYWVTEMHRRRIKPGISVFDSSWIANSLPYIERGLIAKPAVFNMVLGQPGAVPASARHALFLIESLPAGSLWGLTGHGGRDLQTALWAIAFGGHGRAGFEDNVFLTPGVRASSNAALIERIAQLARAAGRTVASPAEARLLLDLPRRP